MFRLEFSVIYYKYLMSPGRLTVPKILKLKLLQNGLNEN